MYKAYAKLNIGLEITGTRADGYHLLDTVMQTIDLFDELDIEKADDGELHFTTDQKWLTTGPDNLVRKAWEAFNEEIRERGYNGKPGATIKLHKNIPAQAGLGGGSSDAATVIKALNEIYKTGFTEEEMERMCLKLGADVPYFIKGGTVRCRGIGELLQPIASRISPEVKLLLVKPKKGVRTPDVYRNYKEGKAVDMDGLTDGMISGDIYKVAGLLGNALEPAAISLAPIIQEIKSKLISAGALGAQMTGSGSCVFALFDDEEKIDNAKKLFLNRNDIEINLITSLKGRDDDNHA